jgi:hypothetical protein
MANVESIAERCLVCEGALPRGGFSAQVAGVFLSPLCANCLTLCSTDPDTVLAQYPHLFERPAAAVGHAGQHEHPRVVVQPASASNVSGSTLQHVVVTDIHMPFGSMVGFMVKWAIASIPAVIILLLLGMGLSLILRTIFTGMLSLPFIR